MGKRAECTLEEYTEGLAEWGEGLFPDRVEANVYFHKTFIPPTSDHEQPEYAIWLRVHGKTVSADGESVDPFKQMYDVILVYRDPEDVDIQYKKFMGLLGDVSDSIRTKGIRVSNLPEFIGLPDGFSPETMEDYELGHEDIMLFDIMDESDQSRKLRS